ncbi:hypothetical protein V6N13_110716 [Hibiscus sabdariffa]
MTFHAYRTGTASCVPIPVRVSGYWKIPETKSVPIRGAYRYERKVVPIRVAFCTGTGNYRTDTRRPKANGPQRLYAYRYRDKRTGTLCTRSAYLAAKSTSTAPKYPQRSPTASR